jgi:hypothetical protein
VGIGYIIAVQRKRQQTLHANEVCMKNKETSYKSGPFHCSLWQESSSFGKSKARSLLGQCFRGLRTRYPKDSGRSAQSPEALPQQRHPGSTVKGALARMHAHTHAHAHKHTNKNTQPRAYKATQPTTQPTTNTQAQAHARAPSHSATHTVHLYKDTCVQGT